MQAKVQTAPTTFRTAVNARWAERILLLSVTALNDAAMVGLGFLLAYLIRFESGIQFDYQPVGPIIHFYQNLVFMLIPAWVVVFWVFGLYDFKNLFGGCPSLGFDVVDADNLFGDAGTFFCATRRSAASCLWTVYDAGVGCWHQ